MPKKFAGASRNISQPGSSLGEGHHGQAQALRKSTCRDIPTVWRERSFEAQPANSTSTIAPASRVRGPLAASSSGDGRRLAVARARSRRGRIHRALHPAANARCGVACDRRTRGTIDRREVEPSAASAQQSRDSARRRQLDYSSAARVTRLGWTSSVGARRRRECGASGRSSTERAATATRRNLRRRGGACAEHPNKHCGQPEEPRFHRESFR